MTESKIEKDDLTFLFHSIEFGSLGVEEVVNGCDTVIAETDEPDNQLIELSLVPRDKHEIKRYLLNMGATSVLSDDMFFTVIAGGYFNGRIDLEKACYFLYQRFCVNWVEMTDLRQEIYLIDDECGWDQSLAKKRLERLLAKYKCAFEGYRKKLNGLA